MEELELPFTAKLLDIGAENIDPEYLKIHPLGWVPALEDGSVKIFESVAICTYLSGWILRKCLGQCPWEESYRASRYSIHDLIRLDYAPAWGSASYIFERVYSQLQPLDNPKLRANITQADNHDQNLKISTTYA